MSKIVLAMCGKKNSGKDSAADYIASKVQGVEFFALATPVKEFARTFLGLDFDQVYGDEAAKNTLTQYRWEDMPLKYWRVRSTEHESGEKLVLNPSLLDMLTGEPKTGWMSAREIVQYWATEVLRAVDPDIFIKRCDEAISRSKCDVAVITDMRFVNEVDFALRNHWRILRFTRTVSADAHRSETELDPDKFDWNRFSGVIDNANLSVCEKNAEILTYLKKWGLA